MEISGLPLHPLVVHATVVLVPVAALAAAALVLAPRWRWWLRWPALLATVGAFGAVVAARVTGAALLEDRPFLAEGQTRVSELVALHQSRADVLTAASALLLLLVVLDVVVLPASTGLASGRLEHAGRTALAANRAAVATLAAATLAAAVVTLVWAVLTGDAGARAVWES